MNMTPIKKFVIGIAVVCVALTIVTSNSLSAVFMLMAARNNQAKFENAVVQQDSGNGGSTISNNNSTNQGNTSSGNVATTPGTSGSTGSSQGSQSTQTPGSDDKAPADNSGNSGSSTDAGASQEDGLKMYVDALNKAKSSATQVVKTKTSASHYKEHLVIDGNAIIKATLEPIGKSLMGTFMKASEPNETIDKNALPPQNIQCTLTNADLQEDPKVEKSGDNTVITLVLKGERDPKAGSGLGSAISIIEDKTITDAVAGAIEISNIHLDYDACTIIATLDASGNLVGLSVNAPCILKLTTMGVNAEVGIECYDEFTIAY
ncbi:MAG: hypothetical protein IJ025_02855 [Clostridia bacterium]|nr:hypothetical protein [Clostridia bacterium]